MKFLRQGLWFAVMMCGPICGLAAEVATPKLTGIVRMVNKNRCLLELTGPSRSGATITTRKPILREGERDGTFEVLAIDERTGTVMMNNGSEALELHLETAPGEDLADRTIHFRAADLLQVLDVYQELIGRTVISAVRVFEPFTLKSGAGLSAEEATAFIEQGLVEKGIGVKLRGTKFVFVDRADRLDRLSAIPDPPVVTPLEEQFAPGMIKFQDSDVLQVLDIYQDLSGRTVLRPQGLPFGKISVRSQTPLARGEAIWLLDALLFAQNGTATFREGDKFVFVVPSQRKGELPKMNAGATVAPTAKPVPAGALKISDADIRQMVSLYAALSGREALPLAATVPHATFSLRSQTILSPAEAMFALEAVAALNNLRLETVGDDKVQIVPSATRTR